MIDYDKLRTAEKVLVIIHILAILAINIILGYKLIRQRKLYRNERSTVILSLAFGDIFLALFSLSIRAKILFGPTHSDMTCKDNILAGTYLSTFYPFVFGFGIITLAVELMLRSKVVARVQNRFLSSLVYSAAPWIVGLIIALPLNIADNPCNSLVSVPLSLMRWQYGISVIVPATLAIIFGIVVAVKQITPTSDVSTTSPGLGQQSVVSTGQTQQGATAPVAPGVYQNYGYSAFPAEQPSAVPSCPPQENYYATPWPQSNKDDPPPYSPNPQNYSMGGNVGQWQGQGYQYPAQPPQNYPGSQNVNQWQGQAYPALQPPSTNQQTQQNIAMSSSHTQISAQSSGLEMSKEKRTIMNVAIVHFCCVVPSAIYALLFQLNTDPPYIYPDANVILAEIIYWLVPFRCILSGIIFAKNV